MSGRWKILVVDDEKIVRESLVDWFKMSGYDVEGAAGGRTALDMLAIKDYDFIFLDIKMPDVNGLEVLDNIRTNCPHSMVVMITAYGSIETAVDAMKRGSLRLSHQALRTRGLGLLAGKAPATKKDSR